MTPPKPVSHERLVAAEARAALAPLGFRRQGRSRIWLADHGFWLGVVEFQPSGWAKGSYLNVSPHWLWHAPPPVLALDHCERIGGFADASTVEFPKQIAAMAADAAATATRQAAQFASLEAVAEFLIDKERELRPEAQGDWGAYHAGIAAGLTSRWELAAALLTKTRREVQTQVTRDLIPTVGDLAGFTNIVQSLIDGERTHYDLPTWRLRDGPAAA